MRRIVRIATTFVLLFAVLGGLLFVIANWQALTEKLAWWFGSGRFKQGEVDGLSAVSEKVPSDDRLVIPKLAVNVPLLFPDSADDGVLLANLQDGVVHYPGTAMPGEEGNLFITGHSSQLAWQAGRYKDVFALLDKLEPGDQVLVYYARTKYVYEVTEERTVDPTEVSILDPTESPTLSLMTCWPVGTIARRLVTSAKLVSAPNKSTTDAASPSGDKKPTTEVLPAIR